MQSVDRERAALMKFLFGKRVPPTLTPEEAKKLAEQRLQKVAMDGDWKAAKRILHLYPELKTEKIQRQGMTALLLAAKCGSSAFVKKFVSILSAEELLGMRDTSGYNVLHHAAVASDVGAARAIVEKNWRLALFDSRQGDSIPLFYAAKWRHPSKSQEMLEYLYSVTDPSAYQSERAKGPVVTITASGCYGIVLSILKADRKLAFAKNAEKWSILHILATHPSAFKSPRKIFWLYPWKIEESVKQCQKHNEARDLVHFVCKELVLSKENELDYFLPADFHAILHLATVHGTDELVEICLDYFPDLIWYSSDTDKRLLLHVAVEHRRVNIFNMLMRLVGENAGTYARQKVEGNNNILHLAANLAPTLQLHSVPGPAFQMQRELQWFKAVESIVYTDQKHEKNVEDKCTPEELFFKKHEKLIKEAKQWMKDTSNSCMVVAALVATVAFASMITVPGGNTSDTGKPVLSRKEVFVVFSVANALSMISSAVAILMFLSLQTARYTDNDFLESLPINLLTGLLSLFIAVATMMIAFGTAIGLALETRIKSVYIPIIIAPLIPAAIFSRLHIPLIFQTLISTSRPIIVERQGIRRYLNKIGLPV